ncbi:hypothetical protein KP806_13875 [Paenibacillus sp. N4]|uniref:hypothetical protein n=1 Tax=Paenibacillus vietnamensis TaxID=2590547 RepID=UPI001CD04A17|nr:hypothetical protein [Paenibacillus vietnamensis]MCA0756140.1 hypothetical protein [Paenibacillus vietnamensis]
MWSKQLKEAAIQLANCKEAEKKTSILQQLLPDQRAAFQVAYAAPAAANRITNAPHEYWS